MVIAVDVMGGDFAPQAAVKGALASAERLPAQIVLVGRPQEIEKHLPASAQRPANLRIVAANDVIEMEAEPTGALRRPETSMFVAVDMVRNQEAQAVVSAGNSGALLTLTHTRLGVIEGVRRPGIAAPFLSRRGPIVLIDAGANVDCQPIHLAQFGLIGSVYAEHALNIQNPRVGLLNIGSEQSKGNSLTRRAFDMLADMPINFVGNVEADGFFAGQADVAVADGFVGNVALKAAEAMAQFLMEDLHNCLCNGLSGKVAALLLGNKLGRLRQRYDYANYGGAPLLGVQGIAVVSHGRSDGRAIASAIEVACRAVECGIIEHLQQACRHLVVEAN
ncbi:MAG: phosphate acyltransferase PlsX [Armatimonadetes bacterium]|nr:phosphate acyltransferase PlsX [Armatimonadota bacterium]